MRICSGVALSLTLMAAACGSDRQPVTIGVGGYLLKAPSGWRTVSDPSLAPGALAIRHDGSGGDVLLIMSPAPSPMPFDPTDPAACAEAGARFGDTLAPAAVIDHPAGKACSVTSRRKGKHSYMTVFAKGEHGIMVNCVYTAETDRAACEQAVARVTAS